MDDSHRRIDKNDVKLKLMTKKCHGRVFFFRNSTTPNRLDEDEREDSRQDLWRLRGWAKGRSGKEICKRGAVARRYLKVEREIRGNGEQWQGSF